MNILLSTSGAGITEALNQIFSEIQAVNSVFASSTLPVSVNVRGTNLNQVYIGVFRPDETKSPRWYGNLKMYKLGFNSTTSTLFLSDADGGMAENPTTGFINSTSPSFWSEGSNYWDFRIPTDPTETGTDDPDGDNVEKGGSAQQQRQAFEYAISRGLRNLYTCTGTCPADGVLTNFDDANTDITNASLTIGTSLVSALTRFCYPICGGNHRHANCHHEYLPARRIDIDRFPKQRLSSQSNQHYRGHHN